MYDLYDLEDCVSPAKKAHAIDYLEGIYEMISGQKEMNVRELYNYLDEVSSALDWDMPYKPEHEDYLHKLLI